MTGPSRVKAFLTGLLLFCFLLGLGPQPLRAAGKAEALQGTITISGAWALYPMVVKWAEEFQKIYPKVKIDIAAGGAGKGMVDCLAQIADLGMVSRDIYPEEKAKGAWWVSVVKDAVVPTMNEKHPFAQALLKRGLKREEAMAIWITGTIRKWNELAGGEKTHEIHVYTRADACGAAETWAKYLGKNQEDLLGVGVYGDPGLAEAVRGDELGLGFNNINYVYDNQTKEPVKGIRILPLDLDGNGVIEEEENFYARRQDVVQAIAKGKYPSPPARNLHLVCYGRPRKEIVRVFLRWVLT
ncbi:MAG: substrate-binding domain-containing protein, partial [Candidatus Omnitrophota bacterium]